MNWLFGSSTAQKLPNSGEKAITPGSANASAVNYNSMNNPFVSNNTRKNNPAVPTSVNATKQNPQRELDFRNVWSAYRVFYNKRNYFMRKYKLTDLDQNEKDLIDDTKLKEESIKDRRKNGSISEDVYLYRKFRMGQQTMKRGISALGRLSTEAQQRFARGTRSFSSSGQTMRNSATSFIKTLDDGVKSGKYKISSTFQPARTAATIIDEVVNGKLDSDTSNKKMADVVKLLNRIPEKDMMRIMIIDRLLNNLDSILEKYRAEGNDGVSNTMTLINDNIYKIKFLNRDQIEKLNEIKVKMELGNIESGFWDKGAAANERLKIASNTLSKMGNSSKSKLQPEIERVRGIINSRKKGVPSATPAVSAAKSTNPFANAAPAVSKTGSWFSRKTPNVTAITSRGMTAPPAKNTSFLSNANQTNPFASESENVDKPAGQWNTNQGTINTAFPRKA